MAYSGLDPAFVQHSRSSFRRSTICAITPIRSTGFSFAKYRQWINIKRGCALQKLEWGCPNGTKYPPRQPIPNRAILPNRARVYRRTDRVIPVYPPPNFVAGGYNQAVKVIKSISKIVAAFRGMHVSPAKHTYASVTDGQTDDGQSGRYASQATQKYKFTFDLETEG